MLDNIVVDFTESSQFLSSEVLIPLLIGICLLALVIYLLVGISKRTKPEINGEDLLGLTGRALENVSPDGKVYVHGEIWQAQARQGLIVKNDIVVVTGIREGLVLEVEKKDIELKNTL